MSGKRLALKASSCFLTKITFEHWFEFQVHDCGVVFNRKGRRGFRGGRRGSIEPLAFFARNFAPFALKSLTGFHHRSYYFQNPDQLSDYRDRHLARLRRGLAGDLDAVSPIQTGETFRHHDLATGNDSAASRTAGAIDRKRRGQRTRVAGDGLQRAL